MTSLTGRLLVATPALTDPNFSQTVVYLVDHDEGGALGVVLNRPSDIGVDEALPTGWSRLATEPSVLFVGGPVEGGGVLALGRAEGTVDPDVWRPVEGGVGIVDLSREPEELTGFASLRLFAGYAGWSPGQLEDEIDAGGWFVLPAEADDPFREDPATLWQGVLRRQGGVFATFPADPSQN